MFTIKRNDRSPDIRCQVGAGATDLSGASVKFIMRLANSSDPAKVSAAASIEDASTGVVMYSWADGDTDTEGLYAVEWEVTFANGKKRTFPDEDYLYVTIVPDLG